MNKHTEFLRSLIREGEQHREIARKFRQKGYRDAKYHDGMTDRSIAVSIRFQEVFGEELK